MTHVNRAIQFYEKMLTSLGVVENNNRLFVTLGTNQKQLLIDGLELVMPRHETLRVLDKDSQIVLHPLSENIIRGESKVLKKLRALVMLRLNYVMTTLIFEICNIFTTGKVDKLSAEQLSLIAKLSELGIDGKFIEHFQRFTMSGEGDEGMDKLISLSIRRMGTYHGVKYLRVCVAFFPLLEQLRADPKKGKFRSKDIKIIEALYEFLLPNCNQAEEYNAVSNSKIAPSLQALLACYGNFASVLNNTVELYKEVLNNPESLLIAPDVFDVINEIDGMVSDIRMIGDFHVEEAKQEPTPQPATSMPQQVVTPQASASQPQPTQPAVQQPPQLQHTKTGKLDFSSVKANMPHLNYMPPMSQALAVEDYTDQLKKNLASGRLAAPQAPMQPMPMLPQYPMPMMPAQMGYAPPMMPMGMPLQMPQYPMQQQMPMGMQNPMSMSPQYPMQQMPMGLQNPMPQPSAQGFTFRR